MGDLEDRIRDEVRRARADFAPSPDIAARIGAGVRRRRRRRGVALVATAGVLVALLTGAVAGSDPGHGSADLHAAAPSGDGTTTTAPPAPVTDVDVRGIAAPAGADESIDACDRPTSFEPERMIDGVTDTAWRMPGDGTGEVVTLDLGRRRTVTEVALVPGYAKVDACDGVDRFVQNRRPTQVTWRFDDGTEVVQELADRGERQAVELPAPVVTATVELHLDEVSPLPARQDPTNPTTYDNTAVSEIVIRGT